MMTVLVIVGIVGVLLIAYLLTVPVTEDEVQAANEHLLKQSVLSDEMKIEYNERVIDKGYRRGRYSAKTIGEFQKLYEHPTIMCRFNLTPEREKELGDFVTAGRMMHGDGRHAVWRRDMSVPECRSCLIEDPYE